MIGLQLVSGIDTFAGAMVALAVYALGKTFFWPTMLAVVGDRFPRTGAVAMCIMGGIGMMSAGLIGAPGLGYAKDRFTAEHLTGDRTRPSTSNTSADAEPVPVPRRSARARRHQAVGRPRPRARKRRSSSWSAKPASSGIGKPSRPILYIP